MAKKIFQRAPKVILSKDLGSLFKVIAESKNVYGGFCLLDERYKQLKKQDCVVISRTTPLIEKLFKDEEVRYILSKNLTTSTEEQSQLLGVTMRTIFRMNQEMTKINE